MATSLVAGMAIVNSCSLLGTTVLATPYGAGLSSHRMPSVFAKNIRAQTSTPRLVCKNAIEDQAYASEEQGRRSLIVGGSSLAVLGALMGIASESAEAVFCQDFTGKTPSGLEYCDAVVGGGITPEKGMLIKAHYTGRLTSGVVFDSSYERGRPLTFKVGVGEVIRGWDEGILGAEGIPPMQAGGKRTLRIPSSLAYGSRGAGCRGGTCVIPPDSTLIFDVEFVGKA